MQRTAKRSLSLLSLFLMASCGGGAPQVPQHTHLSGEPLFTEEWKPNTHVQGTVLVAPLECPSTKEDTEQPFLNNAISSTWGTIVGLAGEVPDLPNVTGTGATQSWQAEGGRIYLHGQFIQTQNAKTDGIALISQKTFDKTKPITLEAQASLTEGTFGAFLGITLIAGEGDFREIGYRQNDQGVFINRLTPCEETTLMKRAEPINTFRLEYHPTYGWKYFVNEVLLLSEPLDNLKAGLSRDPHVGIYITGAGPNTWAQGWVGALKVWQ